MTRKILIVDDDKDILQALEILFLDSGYEVFVCSEGDSAIKEIVNQKPDIVLLDLLLSGTDGGKITEKLKAKKETRHIPVIILSAHPKAKGKALESGADDFLAKPFDLDFLLQKVDECLQKNGVPS